MERVRTAFVDVGLSLPCIDRTDTFEPGEETTRIFSQFKPGEWLATSTINPLISSFSWDIGTLILHSAYIDLEKCNDLARRVSIKPWPILSAHRRIVLPSCYNGHWTLLEIDLKDGIVFWYDSIGSSKIPAILEKGIRAYLEQYRRQNDIAIHIKIKVSYLRTAIEGS